MTVEPSFLILPLALLTALSVWRYTKKNVSRKLPLPPGPKPLPIIGNVLDAPKSLPWVTYRDWSAQYGDVMHLQILGESIIIIGSLDAAFELLEKRSANYSDRSRSTVISMMDYEWHMAFTPYGHWWRRIRRTFWQYFSPGVISNYHPTHLREARKFLKRLSTSPEELTQHIRYMFGATILAATHGVEVAETDDPNILIAEKAAEGPVEALVPGTFLVEYLPFLRHIPAWVPGAGFQHKFARWRGEATDLREIPYKAVKDAFNNGTATPSILTDLLEKISQLDGAAAEEEEDIAKNVVGVAYGAGADTSYSTLKSFFLAMVLYPEVQRKAQAQLDAVVGPGRLPDFEDRDSLVYIEAIVKETLRWQNVVPLGVFHRSVEDDEYNGYFIPGGSLVIPNQWAFLHDPEAYPEPDKYIPERFIRDGKLNVEVRDPATVAYGFGRRICPGRHFADSSLFINIATVLHVFNITPAVDASGKAVPVESAMTSGFLSYPVEFQCSIKPRSAAAEALIRAENSLGRHS